MFSEVEAARMIAVNEHRPIFIDVNDSVLIITCCLHKFSSLKLRKKRGRMFRLDFLKLAL